MSTLVAQQRINSNGHLVTKWVSSRYGEEILLPTPIVQAPRPSMDEQKDRVIAVLNVAKTSDFVSHARFFAQVHDRTISFLYDHFAEFDLEADYHWEMDDTHALDISNMMADNFDDETILAYIALYDIHEDNLADGESVSYVQGLHIGDRNRGMIDLSSSDSVNRNAALLKFTLEAYDSGEVIYDSQSSAYVLESIGVAHTVYANPERGEEIRKFLDDHYGLVKDRDQSGVEMLLNSAGSITVLDDGRL